MVKFIETFQRVFVPGEGISATAVGHTGHVHAGETDCAACAATLVRHGWHEVARKRRLTVLEETGDVLKAEDVIEPPAPAALPSSEADPVAFLREVLKDPRWQAALKEILGADEVPKKGKKA